MPTPSQTAESEQIKALQQQIEELGRTLHKFMATSEQAATKQQAWKTLTDRQIHSLETIQALEEKQKALIALNTERAKKKSAYDAAHKAQQEHSKAKQESQQLRKQKQRAESKAKKLI